MEPVHFEPILFPIPLIDSRNSSVERYAVVAGNLIDNSRMLNLSLRKYYGAVGAGDAVAAQLQKEAACSALDDLNAALQTFSTVLSGISVEAQNTPAASISVKVADVLELRDQIVNAGSFPDNEAHLFAQANVSPEELSQALAVVASVSIQSVTDADLQGAVIFSRAAQQISNVDVSIFLPQDFSCDVETLVEVPTVSPWGAITMVLLLAAASLYIARGGFRV